MAIGRPPKPTALKELAGNPGRRPLNKLEPRPRVAAPPCPKWLTGEARKEYKRVAKLLVDLRVLTEVDRSALAAYALSYAKWVDAEQRVSEQGAVLVSAKGNPYLNPWAGVASAALKDMKAFATEFGLTPASRSRISAAPPEEKTLAELLFENVTTDVDA